MRHRADLIAHIQNTNSQYNLPEFGKKIIYHNNRDKVLDPFSDPAVRKTIATDLKIVGQLDLVLNDLELHILRHARDHDPNTLHLLRTIPGIGKVLSLVILYETHDIRRFPTVQQFASYARLVKCARESAGKRHATSGATRS